MSYANRHLSTFLLCAVFVAPQLVCAEDWANWRGPEQNGISRETGLLDSWSFKEGDNVL